MEVKQRSESQDGGRSKMVFEREIDGMEIMLRIDDYQDPSKHDYGDVWCDCGYSFRFGGIISYQKDHDEILMPEEVDDLVIMFTELLDGKIIEPRELPMIEPDFVFILYPIKDLRKDPNCIYIAPGHELQDIHVEWRIYFWNGYLTENYLTITLSREDVVAFRDFLISCQQ